MKITIEFDADSQPLIRNIAREEIKTDTVLPLPISAIDAGSARLPEPQITTSINPDQEVALAVNSSGTNGISAGAFNNSFSMPDSNGLLSPQSNATAAIIAVEAIDAGAAKFHGEDFNRNVISLTDKPDSIPDGSKAISAGEFKDQGKENLIETAH